MSTKLTKQPWRSHYTKDWANDPFVRALPLEPRMVYFELLDIAWDEGGIKQSWIETGEFVANRIGISKRLFKSCWIRVREKFEEFSPGFWSQTRLENERKKAQKFSEKQSNNAKRKDPPEATAEPVRAFLQSQSHTQKTKHVSPLEGASQLGLEVQDPPKPKTPKEEDPNRAAAIDCLQHFKRLWVETYKPADGRAPSVTGADWKQLGRLVVQDGRDAVIGYVDRFLGDREAFLVENVHALRFLPGRVDRYRITSAPQAAPARAGAKEPPKYRKAVDVIREREESEVKRRKDRDEARKKEEDEQGGAA